MITWTVLLRARPGKVDDWIALANELTESSHRLDAGCVVYLCLQHQDDPLEFTWYEQWADRETLDAHIQRIRPITLGDERSRDGFESRLQACIERREQVAWREFQQAPPAPWAYKDPGFTALIHSRVKEGREAEYASLLPELTAIATSQPGHVAYIQHQFETDPMRFMLFEQWADAAAAAAYVEALVARLGPPRPGERLPARLMELREAYQVIRCTVVA
ncbi:MAG: antibiotic biosynthesis monooxygenase [Dehalococcoidia bacterium]